MSVICRLQSWHQVAFFFPKQGFVHGAQGMHDHEQQNLSIIMKQMKNYGIQKIQERMVMKDLESNGILKKMRLKGDSNF